MSAAEFVRDLKVANTGASSQKLWKVGDRFVITSAATILGQPETYVFEADASGIISNWCELAGSFKGALDHERAIADHAGASR